MSWPDTLMVIRTANRQGSPKNLNVVSMVAKLKLRSFASLSMAGS